MSYQLFGKITKFHCSLNKLPVDGSRCQLHRLLRAHHPANHNRVAIGLVKRVRLREELFDAKKKRVRSDKLFLIGRMALSHWYCRTRDCSEMIRTERGSAR
jgi:hypothetical protein